VFAKARYLAILTLNQVLWLLVVEFYRITYSPPLGALRGPLLGVPRRALLHGLRPLPDVSINSPTKCSTERLANISPTSEDHALERRLLGFLAVRPKWQRTAGYEDRSTLHYFQGALYKKDGIEQAA
jgi:hypothetical protein